MPTTISGNSITTTGDINSTTTGTAGSLVGRNKIIGGDFSTNPWQRGTSFIAVANAAYTADRFRSVYSTAGVTSVLKTVDAPTAEQAGVFTQHCLHVDVTTADTSIAASDFYVIQHLIEGLNAASFGFGQAGTRYVTLSFWHKHTKTGTYCVAIRNAAGNRAYIAEYTQDVTDTWEKATITIPVDTTGTWVYDIGIGVEITFVLMSGTSSQGAANTWQGGAFSTANQVNALDNVNNNFKIALVQLEAGEVATDFEALDVGTVLARCQRYFEKSYSQAVVPGTATGQGVIVHRGTSNNGGEAGNYVSFLVIKRATPVVTGYTTTGVINSWIYARSGVASTGAPFTASEVSDRGFFVSVSTGASYVATDISGHFIASAEL